MSGLLRRRARPRGERVVVHVTTTDMSLDWLLGPQLVAFGDAGYEVVGMSAAGEHVERLTELGVEHVAIEHFTRSSSVVDDLRSFVELVAALRRLRPDIVHTHSGKAGVLGEYAGGGKQTFDFFSHGRGNDWLLLLEDPARGFALPGGSKRR